MVSPNLVMSDRRAPRCYGGKRLIRGPDDLHPPPISHPDTACATRSLQQGAVALSVRIQDQALMSDAERDQERERRLGLLIRRLPEGFQRMIRRLRQPSARWLRIPAGVLLIIGSIFSILPVFGLWMLPLGIVLLADDVPVLQRATDRVLEWIERRRPHWMGLAPNSR